MQCNRGAPTPSLVASAALTQTSYSSPESGWLVFYAHPILHGYSRSEALTCFRSFVNHFPRVRQTAQQLYLMLLALGTPTKCLLNFLNKLPPRTVPTLRLSLCPSLVWRATHYLHPHRCWSNNLLWKPMKILHFLLRGQSIEIESSRLVIHTVLCCSGLISSFCVPLWSNCKSQ